MVKKKTGDFKKYLNVYEFETTFPGSGETIKFKPITTSQMKKLLIYEDEKDPNKVEDALDDLISSTVITENFDIKKMYLQDRFFLLVELRKKTKGSSYKFQLLCPYCKSQSMNIVDLDKLIVKRKEDDINDIVKISDDIAVRMSFVTREMQSQSIEYVNNMSEGLTDTQKLSEITIATHAIAINSIITEDGEDEDASLEDKIFLINNITQGKYELIRGWFETYDFGTDFTFSIKCSHCNREDIQSIPIDNFFF